MGEFTIELKDLHFYAFHGLYEEERRVGGEFKVDLSVKIKEIEKNTISLKDTANYVSLYEVIKTEMQKPQDLLETLAIEISEAIHQKFSNVREIELSIQKKHPPMIGIIGSAGIKYQRSF